MPAPFGLPAELAELQDDYDLLGELGRGGAAVVYRARDRTLGREVAIKVVHPRPTSPDDDPVARLAREARLVAQLQHPNVVAVYAVRRLRGGGLALIMQLVAGGTLKTAVQTGGALAPERTERLLRDVAAALAYAHARGLVHRDVKPENIFLDEHTGRALLADFGIARSAESDSMTMTGTAVGTPFYMSPEQVDGGVLDGRSDLYSLGLVAWEALTGRRPWDGESLYNVIYKQKHEDLPPIEAIRPGVPRRLQYVVERMLQKRPGARWAGAEGLIAQLDHAVLPADYARWQRTLPDRIERFRAAQSQRAAERGAAPAAPAAGATSLTSASTVQFAPGTLPPPTSGPVLAATPVLGPSPDRPWVPGLVGGAAAGVVAGVRTVPPAEYTLPQPGATIRLDGAADETATALTESDSPAPVAYPDAVEPTWDRPGGRAAGSSARRRWHAVATVATLGAVTGGGVLVADRLPQAGPGAWLRSAWLVSTPAPQASATPSTRVDPRSLPAQVAPVPTSATGAQGAPETPVSAAPTLLAAGGRHSCALTLAGRAHCWGANDRGQLGDGGPAASRAVPVAVTGVLSFTSLAGGLAHSCAVTRLDDVYCWGANTHGQLGDATTVRRNAPVRVSGSGAFASVASGSAHTCAVTTDGRLRCWGANDQGQLGDSLREGRSVPAAVRLQDRVVRVAAGGQHSCAVTDTGRLYCWGSNADGQLGTGAASGSAPVPQPVPITGRVTSVGLGLAHTCAATADGALWCWGRNDAGQLGDGTRISRRMPARVPLGPGQMVTAVVSGAAHTCAIDARGALSCWGRNTRGDVGDGSTINRMSPTPVPLPSPVVAVAAGTGHTCATTLADGTLCWGDDTDGQLGDANVRSRPTPGPVRFPAGVLPRMAGAEASTR